MRQTRQGGEQNQTIDAVRVVHRHALRDHASHRHADERRALAASRVEHSDHVTREHAHVVGASRPIAAAGAAVVEHDNAARTARIGREQLRLLEPKTRRQAKALHEHHRARIVSATLGNLVENAYAAAVCVSHAIA